MKNIMHLKQLTLNLSITSLLFVSPSRAVRVHPIDAPSGMTAETLGRATSSGAARVIPEERIGPITSSETAAISLVRIILSRLEGVLSGMLPTGGWYPLQADIVRSGWHLLPHTVVSEAIWDFIPALIALPVLAYPTFLSDLDWYSGPLFSVPAILLGLAMLPWATRSLSTTLDSQVSLGAQTLDTTDFLRTVEPSASSILRRSNIRYYRGSASILGSTEAS